MNKLEVGKVFTEEAADEADIDYARPLTENDDGWVEGVYTFTFDADSLLPDTYTMVLCDDDDSGNVIGEWIFDVRRNGNVELGFVDSWLIGAGEKNAL